jgi:diguanylate cyclase (GGDEF)-like protein
MTFVARLRESVRETDAVARISDDEFFVVLEDLVDREIALRVADKIIGSLSNPVVVDTHSLHVQVSVGIAYFPDHAGNADQLMRRADTALYAAKSAGANSWRVAAGPDTMPPSR